MPSDYDAWPPSVGWQVLVSAESPLASWPGRYINVQRCKGMPMVLLQLRDPLKLFVKRKEFLPGSGFLSCCNIT